MCESRKSSISETTVSSSSFGRSLRDSFISYSNKNFMENETPYGNSRNNISMDQIPKGQTQANVKADGSSKVQFGDVINNNYYYQPPCETTENASASSRQVTSEANQPEPSENQPNKLKLKLTFKLTKKRIIFLICSTLSAIGITLIALLIYFLIHKPPQEYEYFISRSESTKEPAMGNYYLTLPIRRIIIGQTDDSELCFTKEDCITKIKAINEKNSNLMDISWSFLIGGDGNVYEGRGYQYEGEHTMDVNASDYNDIGIGIGFIGSFSANEPPNQMMDTLKRFINKAIYMRDISADHWIFYQDKLIYKNPEASFLEKALKNAENFYDLQKMYSRKEWNAHASCATLTPMSNPLFRVIIHHSGVNTFQCPDFYNCSMELRSFQIERMVGCKFSDTYYNFAIGGTNANSYVMEVRGFSKLGAHTANYNTGSVGIGLIGNYDVETPGVGMMNALEKLINDSVALGKVMTNYQLNVKKDFDGSPSPGSKVIDIVKHWKNFKKP